MADNHNQVMNSIRRLNNRSDAAGEEMADFVRRQAAGEKPDPNEFTALLQKRSTSHDAMAAQFKLFEKPMKTVLNETK